MEKVEKNPHSRQISRTCTGSVLFLCFDQCSYFGHNLRISDPI